MKSILTIIFFFCFFKRSRIRTPSSDGQSSLSNRAGPSGLNGDVCSGGNPSKPLFKKRRISSSSESSSLSNRAGPSGLNENVCRNDVNVPFKRRRILSSSSSSASTAKKEEEGAIVAGSSNEEEMVRINLIQN